MNYEEEYKKDLGRANAKIETYNHLGNASAVKSICEIFPELRESEDERIRNRLIEFISCNPELISDFNVEKGIAWLEQQGEQKPVEQDTEIHDLWVYIREWNDKFGRLPKDEDELAACIDYVMKRQNSADKVEQKPTWSEEDKANMEANMDYSSEIIGFLKNYIKAYGYTAMNSWVNWLKSLRPQPKQSIDEDTQQWIDTIIKDYEDLYDADKDHRATIQAKINILKSLRPQNTWKPSEEQMKHLKSVSVGWHPSLDDCRILSSLYNDLLKL